MSEERSPSSVHFRNPSPEAEGRVIEFHEERLLLHSSAPFAPGQPLDLTFTHGESELTVQAKSLGSKLEGELYAVRARVHSLRKTDRERLRAWLAAPGE